jgi:uncharacterized membrane protein
MRAHREQATMTLNRDPKGPPELTCANCGRRLDPTDKFCRECGLPTVRQAQAQKLVPAPPDTGELKRAFEVQPEVKPFARAEPEPEPDEPLTTGQVVKSTNPTFTANLASSTALMVGVIVVLVIAGVLFLFLAFRP